MGQCPSFVTDDMPCVSSWFSARPHLSGRLPHRHNSHSAQTHMSKSRLSAGHEPWASLFGALVSSTVPPSGQPLGFLLLPSKCPWNPLTLVNRYFPVEVLSSGAWHWAALTRDVLATFSLPILVGQETRTVFSKDYFVRATPHSKVSNYCLTGTVYALWSRAPSFLGFGQPSLLN